MVRVGFPSPIAPRVAGMAGGRLRPLVPATHCEALDERAVHPDVELVRHRAEAANDVVEATLQPDADRVLPVEREVVAKGDTAPGAERQVVARPVVLHQRLGHAVDLRGRCDGRVADRELADAARGEQVPLHQRRRDREHVRDVVEALVVVVGRQQQLGVDLHAEQVAHRVAVLDPVETMDGKAAGRGRQLRRGAVERRLEPRGQGGVRRRVRARPAGRRHRPGPQLPHHPLPALGVCAHALQVHRAEHEAGRAQPLVVAGEAVALEERAVRRRRPAGVLRPGGGRRGTSDPESARARPRRRLCAGATWSPSDHPPKSVTQRTTRSPSWHSSGMRPCLFFARMSPPRATRKSTTAPNPLNVAAWSAVSPAALAAFTYA